ncbi:Protein bimA [Lachnellula willkommii]|uniref:Protein bimA n=1 Tax=Lachnellula willkommii TaxID=215461 RepID=A0A559MMB7_9HELO|nr:Protein bimA [Lachnellula willkommii]
MPLAPDGVKAQLRQLIYYHIDNNLLTNALFFAERLLAYSHREPESAYLVALCHLRLGDEASAYEYSKSHGHRGTHLGCAYVFAQACLALDRHKDGIVALEKSRGQWGGKNSFGKHTQTTRHPYPDAAAITCLLGKLYFAYENKQKAISCFEEALKLNPFMWDAFTILCDMGTHVRVPNIFKMSPEMEAVLRVNIQEQAESQSQTKDSTLSNGQDHHRSRTGARPVAAEVAVASDNGDPFNNVPSKGFGGGLFGTLGMSQKLNESNPSLTNLPAAGGGGIGPEAMETPTGPSASIDISVVPNRRDPGVVSAYSTEPPQAPARKTRTIPGLGMDFSMDAPPKMNGRGITSKRTQKPIDPAEESAATQILRHTNLSAAGGERKRTVSGQVVPRQMSEDPGAPQRRSVRLFNQIRPASSKSSSNSSNVPTVGAAPGRELKKARPPISRIMRPNSSTSTVGRQVSGNRKPVEEPMDIDHKEAAPRSLAHPVTSIPTSRPPDSNPVKNEESVKILLDLFKAIGSGYFALSQYKCQEALHIYKTLPKTQQDTPWVMAQIGRAYYEQAAYTDAEECYKKIRIMAPTRFQDMEIYSTILWHLKRETDLAFLAHELVDSSWQSPQAWCALGNSWSLARDHEQALRCFKRATQLDPKFAYAFTLQGHEHVANEEYDKALVSYRHGMAADKRHYNAWYGVGRVYEKLGNYEKASLHFSSASVINPTNAVLICCIGTVLEKQKQPHKALEYFTRATEVAPQSKLTRFKKARALMSLGRLHEALKELMYLKDIAPDEAMVHFLLGRLYKSLREKGAAVRHFTIALNLDPKASQHIKEAIESLEDEDDDDETSMMA